MVRRPHRARGDQRGGEPGTLADPAPRALDAATNATETIDTRLAALERATIDVLRAEWRRLFRREPPKAFGPDLLRRSIAYRIQEQMFGGLTSAARRELSRQIRLFARKDGHRVTVPRRITSGAILTRTWKGQVHQVTVIEDGFAYQGRTYDFLSEIAREITGTRWSGPRFFGVETPEAPAQPDGRAPTTRRQHRSPT